MVEVIGVHRLRVGDMMAGIDELMDGEKADFFFSDPPWGPGTLKYWQTLNEKQNPGEVRARVVSYHEFIRQMFALAVRHTSKMVFIETGLRWADMLKGVGEEVGLRYLGMGDMLYVSGSRKLPMKHLVFGVGYTPYALTKDYFETLTDLYGYAAVRATMEPFVEPGATILDPCCGLGLVARFAVEYGMKFRGNELSKHRAEQTRIKLRKAVGGLV